MNFDIQLGISFFICAIAVGVSALILSTPIEPSQNHLRESLVLRAGT